MQGLPFLTIILSLRTYSIKHLTQIVLNVTLHSHRGMWRDPDEVLNQNGDIHVLHIDAISYSLSHTLFFSHPVSCL